jgi:hypothetical protein
MAYGSLWYYVKGIVSKLTAKFWMCCGKMKDYNNNKKMTTNTVE